MAIAFTVTTVVLSFYEGTGLAEYVSVYIIEYFIVTLLYSPLNAKAQKTIGIFGTVLSAVFVLIVVVKVVQIMIGADFF